MKNTIANEPIDLTTMTSALLARGSRSSGPFGYNLYIMRRLPILLGLVSLAVSALGLLIMAIGPYDYEFGASWTGLFMFMATPTQWIINALNLSRIWDGFHRPFNWMTWVVAMAFINFILGAMIGLIFDSIVKARAKRAEPEKLGDS
jgi:hypothetical protein